MSEFDANKIVAAATALASGSTPDPIAIVSAVASQFPALAGIPIGQLLGFAMELARKIKDDYPVVIQAGEMVVEGFETTDVMDKR